MAKDEKQLRHLVTDETRAAVRMLLRTARFGALALPHHESGSPMNARVGLTTDTDGSPVLPASSLSGRVESMREDGRASLLVGTTGRGDPLAHARVTVNGVLEELKGEARDRARRRYLARHPAAERYIDFADFSLWRLSPLSGSFIAGYGRAYRLSATDLLSSCDDFAAWNAFEAGAVEHMNDDHADANALYATVFCGAPAGAWRLTGLDPHGLDLALGDRVERVEFPEHVASHEALRPALVDLVRRARSGAP